jgi:hypothetical protein
LCRGCDGSALVVDQVGAEDVLAELHPRRQRFGSKLVEAAAHAALEIWDVGGSSRWSRTCDGDDDALALLSRPQVFGLCG